MTAARNPGQVCACFPGSCRGGEVINGRTVTGHCCRNEVGKAICEPAAIEAAFAADCEAERGADGQTRSSASNVQQLEVVDPWREQAIDLLKKGERLSVSLLMRRLKIRFNRATFVMEQLTREGLIDAQGMARSQAALQPEAKPDERLDWSDFRAISEAKEVDEAIRALLDNQDEDNAVCMVRAVIEEAGERLVRLALASPAPPETQPWQAMLYAPRDGSKIELLVEHHEYWIALKNNRADGYRQECVGSWQDFNGGGWSWMGTAGTPIGWRPLQAEKAGA